MILKNKKVKSMALAVSLIALQVSGFRSLNIPTFAQTNSSEAVNNGVLKVKSTTKNVVTVVPIVTESSIVVPNGFKVKVFATAGKARSNPSSITYMGKRVFVSYQNGVKSNGSESDNKIHYSTIVEYNQNGEIVNDWNITGKCSGLVADAQRNRLIITVNESSNSSMYFIYPGKSEDAQVQHILYTNTDKVGLLGGTSGVTTQDGNVYVSASSPSQDKNGQYSQAAVFKVYVSGNQAVLAPVLYANSPAVDAVSKEKYTLNMADPDSESIVPASVTGYAKQLMLVDHSDAQLIFTSNLGKPQQSQTRLLVGTQIKDAKFATSSNGTLLISDNTNNMVYAITGKFKTNSLFVAAPADSGVAGFVGIVDTKTGIITPFTLNLKNPTSLAFIPN